MLKPKHNPFYIMKHYQDPDDSAEDEPDERYSARSLLIYYLATGLVTALALARPATPWLNQYAARRMSVVDTTLFLFGFSACLCINFWMKIYIRFTYTRHPVRFLAFPLAVPPTIWLSVTLFSRFQRLFIALLCAVCVALCVHLCVGIPRYIALSRKSPSPDDSDAKEEEDDFDLFEALENQNEDIKNRFDP